MPDTKITQTSIVNITWNDLLNFGQLYEAFNDLLSDHLEEQLTLPEEAELFVYDYGFVGVVDTGCVEVEVEYEIVTYVDDEDDVLYQITPKGKLTLELMRRLKLDFEQASQITDEVFEGAEVES